MSIILEEMMDNGEIPIIWFYAKDIDIDDQPTITITMARTITKDDKIKERPHRPPLSGVIFRYLDRTEHPGKDWEFLSYINASIIKRRASKEKFFNRLIFLNQYRMQLKAIKDKEFKPRPSFSSFIRKVIAKYFL